MSVPFEPTRAGAPIAWVVPKAGLNPSSGRCLTEPPSSDAAIPNPAMATLARDLTSPESCGKSAVDQRTTIKREWPGTAP